MHLDNLLVPRHHLFERQDGCVQCGAVPTCNCAANEQCFLTNRNCTTCATVKCVAVNSGSSKKGGVSKGALAGAVIGVLIFLGLAVGLFFWFRRRRSEANREVKKDLPAAANDVLNRPDPSEKLTSRPPTELVNSVRVYSTQSDGTIDLDPESQGGSAHPRSARMSQQSNPFTDGHSSIQTTGSTGSEGTNVIPIALVPPASIVSSTNVSHSGSETSSLAPQRPPRSPELDLYDSSREGSRLPYAASQISGISGTSSRNSYVSGMTYSSEFLNEAPVIVTQSKGVVRQVLGTVKAEMINAPGSTAPSTPNSTTSTLGVPSLASRPSVRSPLAATSFGPSDVVSEHDEEQELSLRSDPFGDEHSPNSNTHSPRSVTTFGTPSLGVTANSTPNEDLRGPSQPWVHSSDDNSRPSSISTQAGSIIADIGSATRVNVGLSNLASASTIPITPSTDGQLTARSPYRTTIGRLITPSTSNNNLGTLEEQQQMALAHAQAQAQAQGGERSRRASVGSAISNTADSILESFPFVPPSPISSRPLRSPPRSPLKHGSFAVNETQAEAPVAAAPQRSNHSPPKRPPPPREPLSNPPPSAMKNRKILGMSTGSQISTASSGLGSFPFQIDNGPAATDDKNRAPPSSFQGRQRASLDTLALTSDLSSYPLGYDRADGRDSFPPH